MRIVEIALLIVVLAIAGWLRYLSATETEVEGPIRNDASEYVSYAYNLETFGVYLKAVTWADAAPAKPEPDATRPPGYPEFLRLFLRGAPDFAFVARVADAQACLGMLTVLLGFFAARPAMGWRAGLVVALLLATSPQLVVYESYLLTETLFTLIVTAATLVAVLALRRDPDRTRLVLAAGFGILIGASALVRPTLQYLPPALLVLAVAVPRLKAYRLPALAATLAFAAMMTPWMLRNIAVTGHASDPRLAIATLQGGSYPDFMYQDDPKTYGAPSTADPRSPEIGASTSAILAEIARKFRSDPVRYLRWYLIGKPVAFFGWNEISGWGWIFIYPVLRSPFLHDPAVRAVSAFATGLHVPLVICAILGMVAMWTTIARRAFDPAAIRALRFVSTAFAFVIALHVIGTPLPRYAVPFRIMQDILSVAAVMVAIGAFRAKPSAAAVAASTIVT